MTKEYITRQLLDLCAEQGVTCLYAVESGSRAWGFASPDSDYDIRFVYIRPQSDYLKITRPRDVIEHMGENDLDMVGWDAVKALGLLKKSNPSIVEWLSSLDSYYKNARAFTLLDDTMRQYFNPFTLAKHYTSVAVSHYDTYLQGKNNVAPKKYLYALRAILSAHFVTTHHTPAPIVFSELLSVSAIDSWVLTHINQLLALKARTKEEQAFPASTTLNSFITASIEKLYSLEPATRPAIDNDVIDRCFLNLLALKD